MLTDKSLEQYRVFPYIAWGLVIGFSYFVYTLTVELKHVQADLEHMTMVNEARVHVDPVQIKGFTH
jgi:hypothetical protein